MRIANGMLGAALCVLMMSVQADEQTAEDAQARSHFGDYRLELEAAYENAVFGSSRGTSVVVKKQVIHHAPALYLHICTEFLSQS